MSRKGQRKRERNRRETRSGGWKKSKDQERVSEREDVRRERRKEEGKRSKDEKEDMEKTPKNDNSEEINGISPQIGKLCRKEHLETVEKRQKKKRRKKREKTRDTERNSKSEKKERKLTKDKKDGYGSAREETLEKNLEEIVIGKKKEDVDESGVEKAKEGNVM